MFVIHVECAVLLIRYGYAHVVPLLNGATGPVDNSVGPQPPPSMVNNEGTIGMPNVGSTGNAPVNQNPVTPRGSKKTK